MSPIQKGDNLRPGNWSPICRVVTEANLVWMVLSKTVGGEQLVEWGVVRDNVWVSIFESSAQDASLRYNNVLDEEARTPSW